MGNIQDFQRQVRLLVRRYRFKELRREPMAALAYLQGDLSSCVDHEDKREEKEFQLLAGSIFSQADHSSEFELRTSLYEEIVSFFPPDMTQPSKFTGFGAFGTKIIQGLYIKQKRR